MSYYQGPYGIPPPPFAAPIASLPPGYPGVTPYSPYAQQQQSPFPFPTTPQPYATQPFYSPYQPQLYQQPPVGYPQQYPTQPYAQSPYPAMRQPYQSPQYAQPMQQQQQVGNVSIDAVGLPQVPGDITLQFPQTFVVEEKILSATRDSFYVKDQQGAMRYKVDGSFTIHEYKTMKNMHGQVLLTLREARFKKREKITIFSAQSIPLLTLEKASAIQIGSKRVHGFYGNRIAGNPSIVITGNFNNTQFRIANAQGAEIASVTRRKFSVKNMTTGQDTYHVVVNHGSPAFVCFLVVALDEIYED